jgi:hypothetical protein
MSALARLTDQALLADVARTAGEWRVRSAAVSKITDPAVLAAIARDDRVDNVRAAAIRRLEELSRKR